jgi:hypothetical protein
MSEMGYWKWLREAIKGWFKRRLRLILEPYTEYIVGRVVFTVGVTSPIVLYAQNVKPIHLLAASIFIVLIGFLLMTHGWYRVHEA